MLDFVGYEIKDYTINCMELYNHDMANINMSDVFENLYA